MKNVQNPLVPGQIVKSKSGHDKGSVFFVVEVIDNDYVLVADGGRRKSENPKKKKVKHLQPYNSVNHTVAEKLAAGLKIDDKELQGELEKSGVIALTAAN